MAFFERAIYHSVNRIEKLSSATCRNQNRLTEKWINDEKEPSEQSFRNEVDTDFTLHANRQWADSIRQRWKKTAGDKPIEIALVVAGQDIFRGEKRSCYDISQAGKSVVVANYPLPTYEDANLAVKIAKEDPDG